MIDASAAVPAHAHVAANNAHALAAGAGEGAGRGRGRGGGDVEDAVAAPLARETRTRGGRLRSCHWKGRRWPTSWGGTAQLSAGSRAQAVVVWRWIVIQSKSRAILIKESWPTYSSRR